jgi:hypothetical protein
LSGADFAFSALSFNYDYIEMELSWNISMFRKSYCKFDDVVDIDKEGCFKVGDCFVQEKEKGNE